MKWVPGRVLFNLSPAQLLIPLEALQMKAEFTQMVLRSCVVSGVTSSQPSGGGGGGKYGSKYGGWIALNAELKVHPESSPIPAVESWPATARGNPKRGYY